MNIKKIPEKEQCFNMLAHYGAVKGSGVFEHSLIVADLALLLANELSAAGSTVNPDLVYAGGLLHDIAKYCEIREQCSGNHRFFHNIEGAKIMEKMGYPALKGIVLNHMICSFFEGLESTEEQIVCYADKRVKQTSIVPLRERYEDALKRYPHVSDELEKDFEKALRLEARLFKKISFKPEDLEDRMKYGQRLL